jgi:hypothetical protein
LQYILTGFTHDLRFRVFAFTCVGDDRVRTDYKVKVDLGLLPKYGIRIQELPLLCREVLERRSGSDEQRTFTYSEADMRLAADISASRAAALAQKKKVPRRPPSENVGAAWRGVRV